MANYNRVILMGNLTRDPEMRYTASNMPVTKIGLAVNDRIKNRQTEQWESRPNFFDCTAFGRTAEVVNQYFKKGSSIFIEGKLRWDSWEDKQSGQKRSKVEVIIDNFEFVGGREDANQGGGGGGGYGGGGGGRSNYGDSGGSGGRSDYGGGPPAAGGGAGNASSYADPPHEPIEEDDIPF